jgi:hypothetical protein
LHNACAKEWCLVTFAGTRDLLRQSVPVRGTLGHSMGYVRTPRLASAAGAKLKVAKPAPARRASLIALPVSAWTSGAERRQATSICPGAG